MKFSEVIGQDHVVKVLKGAIELKNISHAYLFAGQRGTGKTSVARILAKEIGCRPNDLYEIDAASSRGIDEIRELRQAVRTLPFESPYKVYIIDEVHMLTKEAFNALLKTLEEPPEHVIFILATTEPHKLPETITSRCQSFIFKKPGIAELKKFIHRLAKEEKVAIEEPAVDLVALLADGSFRDAAGVLQKAISASRDKKIILAEVETVTGAPRAKVIGDFALALLGRETETALALLKQAVDAEVEMKIFVKLVLRLIRLALLSKLAPKLAAELSSGLGEEELKAVEKLKNHERSRDLPAVLKELLSTYDDIGRFYLPHLPLELAVIKLHQGSGQ